MNVLAKIDIFPDWRRPSSDERAQTFAETGLRHVFEAIGSARITQMTIRNVRVLRGF
jgi:hypothetical protein